MENYFKTFRDKTIGIDQEFESPYGVQKMIYADWIASGRLYSDIENQISNVLGPFLGNTHTETSETGTLMTKSYHHAKNIIRQHCGADKNDVVITAGFGMTGVINKLQRILGLKGCGMLRNHKCMAENDRPVVFITHMEHHSNHTSWYETVADVVIIKPSDDLTVEPKNLEIELEKYKDRKLKIGSFSACSNVTGIITPYYELAEIMHKHGGLAFVDFAASAPYVDINMHPENKLQALDAIFFSPHKFLGGPGGTGVVIFNRSLYKNEVPDQPGGGTVEWTNAWGEYKYSDDIEVREDGGTPGFLQAIKAAMSIQLKEKMGTDNIHKREKELVNLAFDRLLNIKGVNILAENIRDRIGAISFYVENLHYNLVVKLLNDRFGVQVRGGCACAGTYGHFLLDVNYAESKAITELINEGDMSMKPGWIRLSIHPTMTDAELNFIMDSLEQIVENYNEWKEDYDYVSHKNEFFHKEFPNREEAVIEKWFDFV
jgi:selenocysteine lyase/cysteine desulfurase